MSRYISGTVQNRDIGITEGQYAFYRMALFLMTYLVIHNYQNHLTITFCILYHIFVVAGYRDFKFRRQVDHSKSQPTEDKSPMKGA